MRRVRLTFHEGQVTTYDCPGTIDQMLDELAVRTGYDLRPCLAIPPEVVDEMPAEGPDATKPDEAPAAEIPGTEPEAPKEQENEGSQPAQVPGDDGETQQQQGVGRPDVGTPAGSGSGDETAQDAQNGDPGVGEAPSSADGSQA